MAATGSRRDVLQLGASTAAAVGVSAGVGAVGPVRALAQGVPASNAAAEDYFYRDDWFGEPWRKPETAILIHGNAEIEHRVVRMDAAHGAGISRAAARPAWVRPIADPFGF